MPVCMLWGDGSKPEYCTYGVRQHFCPAPLPHKTRRVGSELRRNQSAALISPKSGRAETVVTGTVGARRIDRYAFVVTHSKGATPAKMNTRSPGRRAHSTKRAAAEARYSCPRACQYPFCSTSYNCITPPGNRLKMIIDASPRLSPQNEIRTHFSRR